MKAACEAGCRSTYVVPVDGSEDLDARKQMCFPSKVGGASGLGLWYPLNLAGNPSSMMYSDSLCCYLLCALSSRETATVETIYTSKDAEKVSWTRVDAARIRGMRVSKGINDAPPSVVLCLFNIERYRFQEQARPTARAMDDTGSDDDHKSRQISDSCGKECIRLSPSLSSSSSIIFFYRCLLWFAS